MKLKANQLFSAICLTEQDANHDLERHEHQSLLQYPNI